MSPSPAQMPTPTEPVTASRPTTVATRPRAPHARPPSRNARREQHPRAHEEQQPRHHGQGPPAVAPLAASCVDDPDATAEDRREPDDGQGPRPAELGRRVIRRIQCGPGRPRRARGPRRAPHRGPAGSPHDRQAHEPWSGGGGRVVGSAWITTERVPGTGTNGTVASPSRCHPGHREVEPDLGLIADTGGVAAESCSAEGPRLRCRRCRDQRGGGRRRCWPSSGGVDARPAGGTACRWPRGSSRDGRRRREGSAVEAERSTRPPRTTRRGRRACRRGGDAGGQGGRATARKAEEGESHGCSGGVRWVLTPQQTARPFPR